MTEISFPLLTAFTIGSALAGAGGAWGIMRATVDHVKAKAETADAKAQTAITDLAAFKLKAAETYVSAAALVRLEGRLDEGFKALRDEMRDQQTMIVNALSARPASRRAKEE